MPHCVLLGDSIFDNGAYVNGGPAVIDHLRSELAGGWQSTLLAVDGCTTADVSAQLLRLPPDATHMVISAGGNDALLASGVTGQPAGLVSDALLQLAAVGSTFEASYHAMLGSVVDAGVPAVLCTIYYPAFLDTSYQTVVVAGLTVFNDVIIRTAIQAGLPLVDLRLVCTDPADYANEIEPSSAGGAKIARAIAQAVTRHDFTSGRTVVYS